MKLTFDWTDEDGEQNDEVCRVSLDGAPVITANHDDHGWDGMVGIRDALMNAAQAVGMEIEIIGQAGV